MVPPPVLRPNREQALRSIEELCQPFIDGQGGPIAPIPIQATDFGLCHHMIQQVQNTCQFDGLLVIRVKHKQLNIRGVTERMLFNINSAMKHSYSNDDTCFSIDVIDEILEEDFDALLDEGSKILHSIKGTLLEEEIFSEFD
ncbi:hypothetical protein Tco_1145778 [Tanacetum coccineum]